MALVFMFVPRGHMPWLQVHSHIQAEGRRGMKGGRGIIAKSILFKKLFWNFLLETSTNVAG